MRKVLLLTGIALITFIALIYSDVIAEEIDWSNYCEGNGQMVTQPDGSEVHECPCSQGGQTCYYFCKKDAD